MRRRRRRDPGTEPEHGVNMTPLIDVSLVLVVMLLLATPLAFESSIGVRRSVDNAKAAPSPDPSELIEVQLLDDEHVRLNDEELTRADLAQALPPLLARSLPGKVAVGCEEGVSHGAFVGVLDVVKRSGAREIAVRESVR